MTSWDETLWYRHSEIRVEVAARLEEEQVTPSALSAVLRSAVTDGSPVCPEWGQMQGLFAQALVFAEVEALGVAIRSRSADWRSLVIARLVQDHSVVDIAGRLGVTRQAVSRVAQGRRPLTELTILDLLDISERTS